MLDIDEKYKDETNYVVISLLSPDSSNLVGNKTPSNETALKVWSYNNKTIAGAAEKAKKLQEEHKSIVFYCVKMGHWTLWPTNDVSVLEEQAHNDLLNELVEHERTEFKEYQKRCKEDIDSRINKTKEASTKEAQALMETPEYKQSLINEIKSHIEEVKSNKPQNVTKGKGRSLDSLNNQSEEPEDDRKFLFSFVNHPTIAAKGFKIRGCFNNDQSLKSYQLELAKYDDCFEILTGSIGIWTAWPTKETLAVIPKVYRSSALNELIVGRKEHTLEKQLAKMDPNTQEEIRAYLAKQRQDNFDETQVYIEQMQKQIDRLEEECNLVCCDQ